MTVDKDPLGDADHWMNVASRWRLEQSAKLAELDERATQLLAKLDEKALEASRKWDRRFLELAQFVSAWSKDDSTKCGAVIVRPDRTIASLGYNGFARGCDDGPELYADRETKYSRVVHAEVNAILQCAVRPAGHTLYVWPPSMHGPTCDRCAAVVIQSGITRVVYKLDTSGFSDRWRESYERGAQMYREAGVSIEAI